MAEPTKATTTVKKPPPPKCDVCENDATQRFQTNRGHSTVRQPSTVIARCDGHAVPENDIASTWIRL